MAKLLRMIILLLPVLLLFCGCTPDARELDRRSMIVGMAIDKVEDNKHFSVTIQIPMLGGEETGPQTREFETFTARGESLWDALSELESNTPTVLFFGHLKVVTVSEKVAKEGLRPIIDFLDRHSRVANQIQILMIKDQEAKEFVKTESPLVKLPSLYLERFFRAEQKLARTQDVKLFEYRRDNRSVSKAAVLPIATSKANQIIIQDLAVFKEHKLVGQLNGREVGISTLFKKGVLQDKNKSTTIKIDDDQEVKVALSSIDLKQKTIYKKTNPIHFVIDIKGKGDVIEIEGGKMTRNFMNKVKDQISKDFEVDVHETIKKLQELNIEPFLLGQKIWAFDPHYFDSLDWEKSGWKEAKFTVNVDFEIDNTGQRGIYNKEIIGK